MQSQRFVFIALVFSAPVWCQFVRDRYILELQDPPAAAAAAAAVRSSSATQSRAALREAALRRRDQIRSRQQVVRARAAETGAEVLGSIDLVGNALFVRTTGSGVTRQDLASIPGVRRVLPVREFRRVLDRAVAVHRVEEVWSRVGLDHAGQGVKIAILDSGVDSGHPGLSGSALETPAGYPKADSEVDRGFTNSKVIAARSYVRLLSRTDPDVSARDRVGHGTALAMIAAGGSNTGPLGSMTGVAPKAYVGSYKIFGTPGINDSATDDAILQAIEDAVADGMDILNMSFGSNLAMRLEDDPDVAAIERAAALGVITVAAAGNDGPEFTSLSSPGTARSAITVGASHNDRTFSPSASVPGLPALIAVNSSRPGSGTLRAALADAEKIDSNGLVCAALPDGSLTGKIVLILRGVCTFETKLVFAARAGAIGALVYTDEARPEAITMEVGTATLPAQMLSYADGVAVKAAIAGAGEALQATLDFTVRAVAVDPLRIASFSSAGPSVDYGIKPEITAVGTDFYTATQSFDARGDMYNRSGYTVVDGTSFSTPFVAGVAALLKSAKPGLTVAEYRSLLINTAVPMPKMQAQIAGAGLLDASAAYRATVTASPAVLGLGASDGAPATDFKVEVRNLDTETGDTYTVAVEPASGSGAPSVDAESVAVGAGSTASFHVNWKAAGLAPGTYQGYIVLRGVATGNTLRIPYWHAVKSEPVSIYAAWVDSSPRAFSLDTEAIYFRVLDASGVPLLDPKPEVSVVSGSATVEDVYSIDRDLPGVYSIDLRFGSLAQSSVIEIKAGNAVRRISIP